MPIYEYQCQRCDAVFEALVFSSTKPTCPECGTEEISRLMSAPASPRSDAPSTPCGSDCGAPRSCCAGGCCPHAH
ncbi:MAG: zinc ribbon domain-containing protein [Thermoguttaceae bacterium]|nr:zinc ribbon domain-containing protein [Thermoguttaceae bacterium]